MPRPKLDVDPEIKATALEAIASGASTRDVAAMAGVSYMTISRWAKAAGVAPANPAPPPRAHRPTKSEPPTPVAPPPADMPTIDRVRSTITKLHAVADAAAAVGNHKAAQQSHRDAGAQMLLLARLEKLETKDSDVIRVSRADVSDAMSSVRARVQAMAARPLLCAHCSKELSIALAEEKC